jgi:hypothetical protein
MNELLLLQMVELWISCVQTILTHDLAQGSRSAGNRLHTSTTSRLMPFERRHLTGAYWHFTGFKQWRGVPAPPCTK